MLSTDLSAALQRESTLREEVLRVFKSDHVADRFLNEEHPVLNWRRPIDLIRESEEGTRSVRDLLGRLDAGVAL